MTSSRLKKNAGLALPYFCDCSLTDATHRKKFITQGVTSR